TRRLNAEHFGLDKVKERILEYLAVLKLKNDSRGPILCFAGPPGTGKTSLGSSIARALGRDCVRMSVGGVRDEAEIRGHRRTYIGSRPGKIIRSLRDVHSSNPVFMIDEIEKRHRIPRAAREHGLGEGDITFDDAAIVKMIREYSREAGVRQLERAIETVCRKCARQRTTGYTGTWSFGEADIEKLLGPP